MKNEFSPHNDTEEDPGIRVRKNIVHKQLSYANPTHFLLHPLRIFLVLLIFSLPFTVLSQGLVKGTVISYSKEGVVYSGATITFSNADKKDMIMVSQERKPVKFAMKDIRRIEKTGQKWKLTPNWSYTESTFDVFKFTWHNGESQSLGIAEWPTWDFLQSTGKQENNIWLGKLDWIEVAGAGPSPAVNTITSSQGLIKGSNISYIKKGVTYYGSVSSVTIGEKNPMITVSQEGKPVRFLLKDVRKIENTGQKWKLTASWSSTEMNYSVYKFTWYNGQTQLLGITEWPVWDVTLVDGTKANSLWLEHLDMIEAK